MSSPGAARAEYYVTGSDGDLVFQSALSCRYPVRLELALLDAGYKIFIDNRRLTRKEVLARGQEDKMQGLPRPRRGG